jgi:hypothetical protein
MGMVKYIGFSMILLILLFNAGMKEEGKTLDEVNIQLSEVEIATMKIPESFPYTNPYQSNFTLNDAIYNILHAFSYETIVSANTFLGGTTNWSWNYLNYNTLLIVLKIIGVLIGIWILRMLFVPVVATYIFISDLSEEKEWKLKWYTKILITTLIWIIILITLLILFGLGGF